ncbi:HpcH/HpaI aldolase/citrate lyase family protein [Microbacterium hydrocarbonoxydans]|uniref:Citrate lyase subunit beta / citryl-CoA lyase n=1 Tax=Microbacterium hydrocarbonoxydans TaxID=273678 RepID=A0A1H4MBH3_9MICO|nr:CoA ester lyase [Microbacterium hydrocarbonoxydans]SEB79712.1 citrate lyase subunit beta / citryl-CoA lyase [Microbacterium hydrocarbonoxydans]
MMFALGPALLFCPADRPERFRGALEKADAVILDLEDAVLPDAKAAARGNLIDADLDPDRVIVRVTAPGTQDFVSDLSTLAQTDFRTVMVAKTESAESLTAFDERFSLVALCETARGIHAADRIAAHPQVVAMMWGAEDLVASLGGTSSRTSAGGYRDVARYARSRVLVESGAHGKAAIDAVHLDIEDTAGLQVEAEDAAASGFAATACIHPSQVAVIRAAYAPDAATVDWARAVLAAAESERGVFRFEGRMVDEPVLRHARSVLSSSR